MLLDPTARNITCITLPSNTEKTFSTFIKTLNDVDIAILEPVSSHCFPYQSEKLEFKMFLRDNINSLWGLLVKKSKHFRQFNISWRRLRCEQQGELLSPSVCDVGSVRHVNKS